MDMNSKQGKTSTCGRTAFVRLGLLAVAIAMAVAAVAVASDQRRATKVLTGAARDGKGKALYDLTVKVKNSHEIQKIIALRHTRSAGASKRCLMPDNFSFKTLDIKSNGSFKGHTSGYMFHANIDGKFKSPNKATGHLVACTPRLKFRVKK